ncbi:hypothetical protein ACFV8Z_04880 [Streptomyces sp. NPDC059837]|uniref:hypothetical protein n=1 Tax=Streptomyces sp. NPDC059837 TaxID=3346968 RepID=UPI00366644C1
MEQELFALLKEREEAARGRMERLQGEPAALNERIAAAQDELSRPEIERKTLSAGRRTTPRLAGSSGSTSRLASDGGTAARPRE